MVRPFPAPAAGKAQRTLALMQRHREHISEKLVDYEASYEGYSDMLDFYHKHNTMAEAHYRRCVQSKVLLAWFDFAMERLHRRAEPDFAPMRDTIDEPPRTLVLRVIFRAWRFYVEGKNIFHFDFTCAQKLITNTPSPDLFGILQQSRSPSKKKAVILKIKSGLEPKKIHHFPRGAAPPIKRNDDRYATIPEQPPPPADSSSSSPANNNTKRNKSKTTFGTSSRSSILRPTL